MMSSNVLNEIKNACIHNKTKIHSLLVKPNQTTNTSQDIEKVTRRPLLIKNKLITCYEEDYTRNSNEIIKLWQRN